MAYEISCADSGANCPGSFKTETKDELMEHIKIHASRAHPGMEAPTKETINALMKEV